ncbi:MAG: hypothetical protein VKK42_22065 [Lyngbya sp.]|nr:hypothetical protein [Lyngbya sp.]
MKVMRLVAATALAAGTVMGAIVESAEAVIRIGFPFFSANGDEETLREINNTFLLFNETPDYQPFLDQFIDDPNLSQFQGDVQDFNTYVPPIINSESGSIDADLNSLDTVFQSIDFDQSSLLPIEPSTGSTRSPVESVELAGLEAQRFTGDEISSELGFEISDDFAGKLEIVRYRILDSEDNSNVLLESYLFTDSTIIENLASVLNAGGAENVSLPSSLGSEDFANLATNDLTSIISETENLLGLSVGVETTQEILDGTLDIFASDFDLDDFIEITPEVIVLNDRFEEVANVPEPGTAIALLTFGALGVGLGLKRKLK